jgi:hypothetical protein
MAPLRERLRDPILWTDASQLLKTVAAAVIAWVIAADVLGLAQPFLAPWAALLTVHATVYRTVSRGAQQVGAAVIGVLLAFAAGTTLGVNAGSLAVVLLAGMVAGATRTLRAESTTAAATALVVLLTGAGEESGMLAARLLDTVIGIGVGLLVNLVVWPPLRDRSAARRVDRIDDDLGELLTGMAARLRDGGRDDDAEEWVERARDIEHDIDGAWAMVRFARESGRLNPRRTAAARVRGLPQDVGGPAGPHGAGDHGRGRRRDRPGAGRARGGRAGAVRRGGARPAAPRAGRAAGQPAQHRRRDGERRGRPARPRQRTGFPRDATAVGGARARCRHRVTFLTRARIVHPLITAPCRPARA